MGSVQWDPAERSSKLCVAHVVPPVAPPPAEQLLWGQHHHHQRHWRSQLPHHSWWCKVAAGAAGKDRWQVSQVCRLPPMGPWHPGAWCSAWLQW